MLLVKPMREMFPRYFRFVQPHCVIWHICYQYKTQIIIWFSQKSPIKTGVFWHKSLGFCLFFLNLHKGFPHFYLLHKSYIWVIQHQEIYFAQYQDSQNEYSCHHLLMFFTKLSSSWDSQFKSSLNCHLYHTGCFIMNATKLFLNNFYSKASYELKLVPYFHWS